MGEGGAVNRVDSGAWGEEGLHQMNNAAHPA